jgi:PilX N-terminal
VRTKRENGVALITALLILFLVSAIIVGMSWMVVSDQRLSGNNQDRELAFYGAEAGMEKMTADIGNVFANKGSITAGDLPAITGNPPPPTTLPGITYANASGSTYQLMCPPPNTCTNPQNAQFFATIQPPSVFAGMQGQITPLTLRVAAQTADGAEVKIQRQVELVAIPVFQFGVFSNTDLSFFNGPPFDFGGRVHTNGNLWLASNNGPVYFRNTITVSGQVIRSNLENGLPTVAGGQYGGAVVISLAPNAVPPPTGEPAAPYQTAQWWTLGLNEGSMNGPNVYGALSGAGNGAFAASVVATAGMISIGSPQLNLISTALGGLQTPVALIRRPDIGEAAANPTQFSQRYFTNVEPMTASLRILLDDYQAGSCVGADMLALDTVSATTPVDLASLPNIAKSGATSATYSAANGYWQKSTNPTISGCLKIEYLNNAALPVATDVTAEILAHGYRGRNLDPLPAAGGVVNWIAPPALPGLQPSGTQVAASACLDPDPNAIIRIERVRDNPSTGAGCGPANGAGLANTDYWPNVLFDTREGVPRNDALPPNGSAAIAIPTDEVTAVGNMYYIELDVANLAKWFMGTLGAPDTGTNANSVGGYSVYFSDRRGDAVDNQVAPNKKTGSLGFNDFVNPGSANACPNLVLDAGEDIEGDGVLRTYGGALEPVLPVNPETAGMTHASDNLQYPNNGLCANVPPLWGLYLNAQEARENPPMFFRHALKLVDGISINLGAACYGAAPNPPCGLTIASENPVYIQGDYNAPGGNVAAAATIAASVSADAVTLLSDNYNDVNTYINPYVVGGRTAVTTAYRVAIIGGKQIPFALPAGETQQDFGTDGGLHNFLRYIENWGPATLNYEGSLVSFYYSRQAVGLYKGISYSPPSRVYAFDGNFTLGPQWLPPRTPTLRTVNTTGFSQMLMPTQ